jgi:hypothetical protein
MERKWLNETRTDEHGNVVEVLPDENGDYTLEIQNNRGHRISTFKGKSLIEVNEKMAEAQVQANRQLGRLLKPDNGREQPIRLQPQEITSADRLRYSSEITDPNRIVETVAEIVTKKQGAPPETVGQRLSAYDQEAANRYYREEAEAFMAEHPDYHRSPQNQQKLFAELQRRGYDLTRNNLSIVFEALRDDGELDEAPPPKPPEPEPEPEPVRAVPRFSGLRNGDANGMKPPPPKPKPTITWAEIEKMPRREFEERCRDPKFRQAVDSLGR